MIICILIIYPLAVSVHVMNEFFFLLFAPLERSPGGTIKNIFAVSLVYELMTIEWLRAGDTN